MKTLLIWTLLFTDGSRETVRVDPALRDPKPPGLYSYVEGDGASMFFGPRGWDTSERYMGSVEYPADAAP